MMAISNKQISQEPKGQRWLARLQRRFYKRLFAFALLLGCVWGSALPAQAGFAAPLVPYKDTLWIALYVLVGLFVIVAIWEIAVMIMMKRAAGQGEDTPKDGESKDSPASDGGLMGDSEDPFQALLKQADGPATPPVVDQPGASAPVPPGASDAVAAPKPFSPFSPASLNGKPESSQFNGSATVAVGARASSAPPNMDDPFRRLTKVSEEEASKAGAPSMTIAPKPISVAPASAPKPIGMSAPAAPAPKPLSMTPSSASKPLGMAVPGSSKPLSMGSSVNPATVRMSRPDLLKPASVASSASEEGGTVRPTFSGSATVAVRAGSSEAKPVAGIQPKPEMRPLGMAGNSRLAGAGSANAEGKPAGESDDPWKKLLGQSGGRMGASGLNRSASGASKTLGARPADGSDKAGTPAGPVANDPWKALLNNAGKGSAPGSKLGVKPAGQSNGLALDVKKNDSPGTAQENL